MKITKLGHCCLLIKHKEMTILTDPGSYTIEEQNKLTGMNIVLITHEHPDHLHVDSVREIVKNNPKVQIITNQAVGKYLDEAKIDYQRLEKGENTTINEVLFEGYGEKHALIHKSLEPVQNTGYFIDNKLFYPGDALTEPNESVDILALPVAGP